MPPDKDDSDKNDAGADAWTDANARVWTERESSPPAGNPHEAPVEIAALPWQDAFLLAGSLRSAGIEAFLDPPDPPTTAYGDLFRRPYHVLVYRADAEEARAIAAEVSQA